MNIGYGFSLVFTPAPTGNIAAAIFKGDRQIVSRFAMTKREAVSSLIASAPFLRESQIKAIAEAC
jgi:hypothetical protein